MDLSSRPCSYLFLRILFLALSDQGTDRPRGRTTRAGLPGRGRPFDPAITLLVRAFDLLVLREFARADGDNLDRPRRIRGRATESMASTELLRLLRVLFVFCCRLQRVLQ